MDHALSFDLSAVRTKTGRDAILEHSRELTHLVEKTRVAVREKAKVVIVATAVTITATSLALGALQSSSQELRIGTWTALLVLFAGVLGLLLVALSRSLKVVSKDTTEAVSTDHVVEFAAHSEAEFDTGVAQLKLASETLAAAVQAHAQTQERVNLLQVAQSSLKWGLYLLPVLILAYVVALRLNAVPELQTEQAEVSRAQENLRAEHRQVVDQLNRKIQQLEAKTQGLDAFQTNVNDRLDALAKKRSGRSRRSRSNRQP